MKISGARKGQLALLLIAGLAAIAATSWWRSLGRPPLAFTTVPVKRGDLVATIGATGTIEPLEVVDVGAQVAGRISSFGTDTEGKPVDFGSVVQHHLRTGMPDDFKIRDHTEISQTFAATSRVMTNLLLVVALISLIVGGVGIMNIMLVSVTERTREIGIRMAVGARSRDILRQFLVEAVVLCLAGGLVGILFGRGVSIAITHFLHWPTLLSVSAIVASVAVSCTVGILFGFYPAWKASRLDPIEALRYE
jgi:ABC-type antimicrobial peptide transport system permease subunit